MLRRLWRKIRQFFCHHEFVLLRHMDEECNTFVCTKCRKGMLG